MSCKVFECLVRFINVWIILYMFDNVYKHVNLY